MKTQSIRLRGGVARVAAWHGRSDVANLALFLASDASAYTSGAVIPCDGGLATLR